MSHFTVGLILPKSFDPSLSEEDITNYIAAVMEPFSEAREVPAYQKTCYCKGSKAHARARAYANKMVGEPDSLRAIYWSDEPGAKVTGQALFDSRDETIRDRLDYDPDQFAPDPDCDDCHGSGLRETTYNPASKWDWYVIGGRWDGEIQRNARDDGEGGFNFGADHHQLKNNTALVKSLLPLDETTVDANVIDASTAIAPAVDREMVTFFAVLTPDGEWIEQGSMGWWAMVAGEKHESDWKQELIGIYNRFASHLIVALDCHI